MADYRVRYTLAAKLVNELVEAADDKQLAKTIARDRLRRLTPTARPWTCARPADDCC
jgi:hypothetical protein